MKNAISLIMVIVMCLFLCACGGENGTSETSAPDVPPPETTVTNDVPDETEELEPTTESETIAMPKQKMGEFTLDEITKPENESSYYGLFLRYPDNTFDYIAKGYPMNSEEMYMTYGIDQYPQGLVMTQKSIRKNSTLLTRFVNSKEYEQYAEESGKADLPMEEAMKEAKIVLFWPSSCGNLGPAFFSIDETGYVLSGWDAFGVIYADSGGYLYQRKFSNNPKLMQAEFYSVNGMSMDEFRKSEMFTQAREKGYEFASFDPATEYVLTEVDGTKLIEHECSANYRYFWYRESEETLAIVEYTPTTDGYAILDFSNTPPGEYVFQITAWSYELEKRFTYLTVITVYEGGIAIPGYPA